jgi:predicted anti-sigma-YlaC factor YlaD
VTDPFREWDAAYVLGALEPGDRRTYEEHLQTCDDCREAVAELAGMPGVLRLLPPDEVSSALVAAPEASGAHVVELASVARQAHRNRTRRTLLVSLAAAVLVVAGVLGGAAIADRPGSAPPAAVATQGVHQVRLTPVDGAGVSADLTMASRAWGTRLDWSCSYDTAVYQDGAGPVYQLVVVDHDGRDTVVATWSGYGATAHGLGASTSVPTTSIASVEIRLAGSTQPLASGTV